MCKVFSSGNPQQLSTVSGYEIGGPYKLAGIRGDQTITDQNPCSSTAFSLAEGCGMLAEPKI